MNYKIILASFLAGILTVGGTAQATTTSNSIELSDGCTGITYGGKLVANLCPVSTVSPSPTSSPTASPSPSSSPVSTASKPSDLLDLRNWYEGLPIETSHAGNPDIIRQPELTGFESKPWFMVNDAKDGVIFRARVDGAHTENSQYSRSELREMNGSAMAAWSSTSGKHSLEGTYSINHNLEKRKQLVFAQVHTPSDDLWLAAYDNGRLVVFYDEKNKSVVLEPNYVLGTKFSFRAVGSGNHFDIYYNGQLKGSVPKSGPGLYWKSGCYVQSNVAKWGEAPGAWGEVTIYRLKVSHE